ncbi:MAG: hypothetical protein K8S54_10810 [Spirochaetia bacterium]|nr:hypothetical protein [Spirochaetia bacterium]
MSAAAKPQDPNEQPFEVLDLQQSTEYAQALEARGDFKFKGIFKVFQTILDWTTKFSSTNILPSVDQIAKDVEIPADRLNLYLLELQGRGSSKEKFIESIPYVDLATEGLVPMIVFARPTKADGTSGRRYAEAYRDKSLQSIKKYLSLRRPLSYDDFEKLIRTYVDSGKLGELQAGSEISRLFFQDPDPNTRKKYHQHFVIPIYRKLVEEKHLVALPEGKPRVLLYNTPDELWNRYFILADMFLASVGEHGKFSDRPDPMELGAYLNGYDPARVDGMRPGYKQAHGELILLCGLLEKRREEETERKKKEELQKLTDEVARQARVTDVRRYDKYAEELRSQMLRSSGILQVEIPSGSRMTQYILHKTRVKDAIKSARETFDQTGDPSEVRVLSAMSIEDSLNPEELKAFHELEQRTYLEHLPWLVRVWRALFGSGKLKPEEVKKIKQKVQREQAEASLRIRKVEAERSKKELVSKKVKGAEPKSENRPEPKSADESGEDEDVVHKNVVMDEKIQETVRGMVQELDHAWERNLLPNRNFLIEKFPTFNEETIINFLKKYGRTEILSFRVPHDKPEYLWPILITRRYVKAKGKAMLSKAKHDADEQRTAMMPNQEKFDVATALEDFLTRILVKI